MARAPGALMCASAREATLCALAREARWSGTSERESGSDASAQLATPASCASLSLANWLRLASDTASPLRARAVHAVSALAGSCAANSKASRESALRSCSRKSNTGPPLMAPSCRRAMAAARSACRLACAAEWRGGSPSAPYRLAAGA